MLIHADTRRPTLPTGRPLHAWDAVDLAHGIRTRVISARDAVRASLARLEAVNPALNAVVDVLADAALAQADTADAAVRRGDALGPLHGVPVTIKINVDMAGRPTSNGIVALRDLIASEDSPVVANWRRAGAIPIGRTNTPAFSFRWFTENDLHGRTLNPWSPEHTPGGSSGGASAALAAGIGALAHGNDFGGSVRYPAYCTGTLGLRPSFGRVPAFNPSASEERPVSAQWMSTQGPLARSVRDLRVGYEAMAVGDPRDPWWVPVPLHLAEPPRPIRVAATLDAAGSPASEPVAQAIRAAADALADAGYVVDWVDPPMMREVADLWNILVHTEAREFMGAAVARWGDAGIRRAFAGMLAHAPAHDAAAHMRALARRNTLLRQWMHFLTDHPLVLGPVSALPPMRYGEDTADDTRFDQVFRAQAPLMLSPLLGIPAISVPTGLAGGLPIGVQLHAPRFREEWLLQAAEVLEARFPIPLPIDPRR